MRLERAIFTSASSMTGQGYRVVAASPGLPPPDRQAIATSSPSHNSMIDPTESAEAVAFYPLSEGRFCVARSCHAGREQTARGGFRVLTQAFVMTPEQLAEFGCNPFAVLRSLHDAGALVGDAGRSGSIEAATVLPRRQATGKTVAAGFEDVGSDALAFLIDRAMNDGCLIVADRRDPTRLAEAAILALPAPLRTTCSLSIGLKFTLSRRRRLNFTGPEIKDINRVIRGQKIDLIEGVDPSEIPTHEASAWAGMVLDCHATGHLDGLLELNALGFDPPSLAALSDIAASRIKLNHLNESSDEELLDLITIPDTEDVSSMEQELADRCSCAARDLLVERVSSMSEDVLRGMWLRLGENDRLDALRVQIAERIESLTLAQDVSISPRRA